MQRDRSNRQRLDQPPVIIFFVILLLLEPAPAPAFAIDAGSDRTISANAVIFAAEAEAEEVSGQHFGTTESIPSSSSAPLYLYLYPRAFFVLVVVVSSSS